jgi:DNA-binding winged helix-turn-helix (wHTH) protein/TolB-like protein
MIYRFGIFEFDDRFALLTRADRPVALEPQPARALALLVARAGEMVSRDELRAHLWGDQTHVDYDRGLAYSIGQLRAALGDTADNPRFVQTLPRRGFRFIAPVEVVAKGEDAGAGSSAPSAPLVSATASAPPASRRGWNVAAATLVALAILGALGAWLIARDTHPGQRSRPIIAVAVFENESGNPAHERAITALSDVIVERLTALGPERVGVNGNASILRRPRDARDANAVAKETGATFLVSGQLQTKDGRLSLLMQLIRLDDGTHVWVQRIARPTGDPLDTLDDDVATQIEAAVREIVLRNDGARGLVP